MKLLIIEGPDRCGKNTLIKNLTSQSDNVVIRHFGTAKGSNDHQKRAFQYDFFHKEFEMASKRHNFDMKNLDRYPKDLWIWNRGHIGEFVYGRIYRNTSPEQWVLQMEKLFGFDLDPEVYLLLLHGDPEFLTKRDDGQSFTNKTEGRKKEIESFMYGWQSSSILNKLKLSVTESTDGVISYKPQEIITKQVSDFLWDNK